MSGTQIWLGRKPCCRAEGHNTAEGGKAERKGNLAEFLAASPLRRSGLKLKRLPLRLRRLEL